MSRLDIPIKIEGDQLTHGEFNYIIRAINDIIALTQIEGVGFHVTDSAGNTGMKYDDSGLDAALLSSHFQELIKKIDGLGLTLGETSSTAYAGDKGKQNADNVAAMITRITSVATSLNELKSLIASITENGFHVTDSAGNTGMKYDDSGLDAALLSSHFQELIKKIDGLGLTLGETSSTAYAGDKGKQNADNVAAMITRITSVATSLNELKSLIASITENGFHVTDSAGNVGMKYDDSGLDVALLSSHFQELIKKIDGLGLALGETSSTAYAGDKGKQLECLISQLDKKDLYNNYFNSVDEDGIYVTDSAGYVMVSITNIGINWAKTQSVSNGIEYELTGIIN